jgi:MFS family permease
MALPRALFMLVGGASVDRFSPRLGMAASNGARMLAISVMAAAVLGGRVETWMLYAFALVFGLADGFGLPAQMAIVPSLVDQDAWGSPCLRMGSSWS